MKNNKYIVLFDMDGVIADWFGRLYQLYTSTFPDRPFPTREEVTQFYVENHVPEEHRDDVMAIPREPGFYSSLTPIPGALEALKDIEENCLDFIEPFICSSPEVEYKHMLCHSEKAAWVEHYLGPWWTKRLVLTKDKTLVRGHFLVDDKPEITGALEPTWGHLVFNQPYNQDVVGNGRFTWKDWPKFKALLQHLKTQEDEKNHPNIQVPEQSIVIAQPEDVCRIVHS